MKLKNVILGAAGVMLVVVGFGVYYLSVSLDGIVRKAIEDYGSEILGTTVRVSSVSIELREGKGTIRGLRVANPDGFPAGDSVSLGEIALGIDAASLTSQDPVVITLIRVSEPSVLLVTNAEGGTNLQAIQENAERYSGGGDGVPAGESGETPTDSGEPPTRISIRKFNFEGGRLAADLTAVGGNRTEAKLPPLQLSEIGGKKGGTPGEVGATVATAFVKSCLTAVARSQLNDQLDRLVNEKLGGPAGDAAKEMVKGLFGK